MADDKKQRLALYFDFDNVPFLTYDEVRAAIEGVDWASESSIEHLFKTMFEGRLRYHGTPIYVGRCKNRGYRDNLFDRYYISLRRDPPVEKPLDSDLAPGTKAMFRVFEVGRADNPHLPCPIKYASALGRLAMDSSGDREPPTPVRERTRAQQKEISSKMCEAENPFEIWLDILKQDIWAVFGVWDPSPTNIDPEMEGDEDPNGWLPETAAGESYRAIRLCSLAELWNLPDDHDLIGNKLCVNYKFTHKSASVEAVQTAVRAKAGEK